ncbi:MAG: 50S ribosomal protein L6 [Kiritimatiellae bacterium]|nr:50S ribosomal protein L6 [Kiritimatiellia bacterium]MDD4736309.1 50S ribosomal protein L6 [Kiritimatiellia bacterium]
MSRVGKKTIAVPDGVTVSVDGRQVTVKGPKGDLNLSVSPLIEVVLDGGNEVVVTRKAETKEARSVHGTTRTLIANMVEGVKNGFKKQLEINGVGFRAQLQGNRITMSLGYSHPILFDVPEGITAQVPDQTNIVIEGCDKQQVGEVSARLRAYYPAEPYKGKGVKYKGERIRRKAGKTVA